MMRFLTVCLILINVFWSVNCLAQIIRKPNILFITTDYQAGDDIPGITSVLQMPNLAKLMREGATFQNHYSVAPVCIPSRYSIISGMYPHYHGNWDNTGAWLPPNTPTLMEILSKNGYHTVGIGKMHFSPWDRIAGFQERIIADRKGNVANDTLLKDDYSKYLATAGFTRWDYLKKQDQGDIYGVYDWPFEDSLHIDYYVGNETVRYIKKGNLSSKPWFLWVSFNGPHNPWDPPKRFSDEYLKKDLSIAAVAGNFLEENPFKLTDARYNYTRKVVDQIDKEPLKRDSILRRILAGHYGGLSFIDDQIGKILTELQKQGHLENTIIIFSADHGAHLGDHNLIHKGTPLRRSANIPFIVYWEGEIRKGIRTGFTSHIDLMPTLLDIAGIGPPSKLEGKSMIDVFKGKSEGADHAIVEIRDSYSWITKEYNFGIYFSTREEVLYDLTKDPGELRNVVLDPSYVKITDSLRKLLYKFHPSIKSDWLKGRELKKLTNKVKLYPKGINIPTPDIRGKTIKIKSQFVNSQSLTSPLFSFSQGNTHGLFVFLSENKLQVILRTYYENKVWQTGSIGIGKKHFSLEINEDGRLQIKINGNMVLSEISDWPLPYQTGVPNYMNGTWQMGKKPDWYNSSAYNFSDKNPSLEIKFVQVETK